MSNYSKIKTYDIANGPGIRTSIFFSGCPHHCPECFNEELWNPNCGQKYSNITTTEEIYKTINNHIEGISILGGEPLADYNLRNVEFLCYEFKEKFPNKTIWLWTGYTIEELEEKARENKFLSNILLTIDILVDGRFEKDKKDLTLKWKGSSNQRVIDMKESIKNKKIILYKKEKI